MALPSVPGWITDYVTARKIFSGNDDALKSAVTVMCTNGTMKFCAIEAASFKDPPEVHEVFCVAQNCKCNLSQDIAEAASALPDVLNGRRYHPSDRSCRLLVACAIIHNYGILSSKTGMFLTPNEVGIHHGVTCMTLEEFVAAF